MGNKHPKYTNEIHNRLNRQIVETLNSERDMSAISEFKDNLKKKFNKINLSGLLVSNLSSTLNNENKLLNFSNLLIQEIYSDNGVNNPVNQESNNINFVNSYFTYNILDPFQNKDNYHNFHKDKIASVNNFLSSGKDKENVLDTDIFRSISYERSSFKNAPKKNEDEINYNYYNYNTNNSFDKEKERNFERLEKIEQKEIKFLSSKIIFEEKEKFNKELTLNKQNIKLEDSKEITYEISNSNNKLNSNKKTINNIQKTTKSQIQYPAQNTSHISNVKAKKHPIKPKKQPIVNIKINLKDIVREDVIEQAFKTEPNNYRDKTPKNIKNKDQEVLNLSNLSKVNLTTANLNDTSFIEVIDIFQQQNKNYVEILKKNKSKSPGKSYISTLRQADLYKNKVTKIKQ